MQEFCPLCLKNGTKTRVKSFQLNFQEAIFMCATEKCTWPVGYEDVTIMNRPVGKEWSSTWDDSAIKYIRNEHDMMIEFSSYTPPQTPSNETVCKDISNSNPTCTSLSNTGLNSIPAHTKESLHKSKEFCPTLSKSSKSSSSPANSSINNKVSLKPKVMVSKSVNYKLERLPTQGFTLKTNNRNKEVDSDTKIKLTSCKANTNVPTSLNGDSRSVKEDELNLDLSIVNVVKENSKSSTSFLNKRKRNGKPYEKFDFNKLLKQKSTNGEKKCGVDIVEIDLRGSEERLELNQEAKDNVHSSELPNSQGINMDSGCYNADSNNPSNTKIENKIDSQLDFNSILGLSNSSKDSGVDQDLAEKDDLDSQLDELLSVFTDELSSSVKTKANDNEEYEWINSLFE